MEREGEVDGLPARKGGRAIGGVAESDLPVDELCTFPSQLLVKLLRGARLTAMLSSAQENWEEGIYVGWSFRSRPKMAQGPAGRASRTYDRASHFSLPS